jgi:hypothetical protein
LYRVNSKMKFLERKLLSLGWLEFWISNLFSERVRRVRPEEIGLRPWETCQTLTWAWLGQGSAQTIARPSALIWSEGLLPDENERELLWMFTITEACELGLVVRIYLFLAYLLTIYGV